MAEGQSPDEVLDGFVERPQEEVEWLPEWDEELEERPGKNTRIEDNTLIWERDGFEARLESTEVTHWRAEIDIPERVGQWFAREIDLKASPRPEYGFVESVETENYAATAATIVIQENYQPTWEVNKFIDYLLESAQDSEDFQQVVEERLEDARANEA